MLVRMLWVPFLVLSIGSGCSTLPAGGQTDYSEVVIESVETAPLPDVVLTSRLMNELFVADVAMQRGHYAAAVDLYVRLAHETQDPRLADRATRVAVFAREYKSALDVGQLWLKLDPANIDGRQIMTALLVKSGDYDAALESLEALMLNSAESGTERYLLMFRLLGREQDKEGATEVMRRFVERHPEDVAGLYTYSRLAMRGGKFDEAEQAIDQLLEQKADWTQAVLLKVRIMQATNRDALAVEYLGQVVNRRARNVELRVAYGRMLVNAVRPQEAYEQFKRVLKTEPDHEDVLFAAGLVALRLDELKEAERYFLRLNHKSVRVDQTSYYLGRIEEVRENNTKAIHWYGKVNQGESFLNAKIRSALLQAREGDVDAALAYLHTVQAYGPGQKLRLYLAEGEILRDIERYEESLALYNRALQEVPGNTELLYARAMVFEKLDQIDALERDLRTILDREPDHTDALNSLGYTLADRTDRLDEAYTYIKRAYELRPEAFHIIDSMGWVQFRLGNIDEAINFLTKAIELSQDTEIAAHLGEVLWVKGDREAARKIWNKARKKYPNNKILLNAIKRLDP